MGPPQPRNPPPPARSEERGEKNPPSVAKSGERGEKDKIANLAKKTGVDEETAWYLDIFLSHLLFFLAIIYFCVHFHFVILFSKCSLGSS